MVSALMLAAIALLNVEAASARPQICDTRLAIVKKLQSQFEESRQVIGSDKNGVVMELFANPNRGTWTILLTNKSGITCVVSAGQNFSAADTT